MIKISYLPEANTMAKVSLINFEQKLVFKTVILATNVFTALVAILYSIKFISLQIEFKEIILFNLSLLWLFGRKSLTLKLLEKKMRQDRGLQNIIQIKMSKNGIVWSGESIKNGDMPWQHIQKVIQTKAGYILPTPFGRFLWLPLTAFEKQDDINVFKQLIEKTKQVFYNK